MWFLFFVLVATTSLLCYAGYIFLIVDKRQAKQVLENPDIYEALDDKEYDFELPIEIEEYEQLRESKPADKCGRLFWRCLACGQASSLLALGRPGILPTIGLTACSTTCIGGRYRSRC
jgi:hypothetical protein